MLRYFNPRVKQSEEFQRQLKSLKSEIDKKLRETLKTKQLQNEIEVEKQAKQIEMEKRKSCRLMERVKKQEKKSEDLQRISETILESFTTFLISTKNMEERDAMQFINDLKS